MPKLIKPFEKNDINYPADLNVGLSQEELEMCPLCETFKYWHKNGKMCSYENIENEYIEQNKVKPDEEIIRESWNDAMDSFDKSRLNNDSFDSLVERNSEIEFLGDIQNKTILDIGCANGTKLITLLELGASKGVGIDISDKGIVEANNKFTNKYNVEFYVGDINNIDAAIINCATRKFDIIIIWQTLYYCSNLSNLFKSAFKLLKDNGKLVILTPSIIKYPARVAEVLDIPIGEAYLHHNFTYRKSKWDYKLIKEYNYTLTDFISISIDNGFYFSKCKELDISKEQREKYPVKTQIWYRWGGSALYEFKKLNKIIKKYYITESYDQWDR